MLVDRFSALSEWSASALEASLRSTADAKGLKAADLIHPLRAAITGRLNSPGIFITAQLIGKETVLLRIQEALR
jgi:glutamyl-tRNA synthetase